MNNRKIKDLLKQYKYESAGFDLHEEYEWQKEAIEIIKDEMANRFELNKKIIEITDLEDFFKECLNRKTVKEVGRMMIELNDYCDFYLVEDWTIKGLETGDIAEMLNNLLLED